MSVNKTKFFTHLLSPTVIICKTECGTVVLYVQPVSGEKQLSKTEEGTESRREQEAGKETEQERSV